MRAIFVIGGLISIGFVGGILFALQFLAPPALPPVRPVALAPSLATPAPPPNQPTSPAHVDSRHYAQRTAALLREVPDAVSYPTAVEDEILERLNLLRAQRGLVPLRHRDSLQAAARVHGLRMQRDDFFAHEDPDGKGVGDRIAAVDRSGLYRSVGENLGRIAPILAGVARDMHEGWVASPGHFTNMIKPAFTHIGIGCTQDRRQTLCTQVFGQLAGTLAAPLPLELRAGTEAALVPDLGTLEYGGWRLRDMSDVEQAQGTATIFSAPPELRGAFRLSILGVERQSPHRRLIYAFFGPTIILE